MRGIQILHRLALEGLICFGVREGKQQTFVLLDEWIPKTRNIDQNNALRELALRYFTSHGPASIKDFRWWSGLKDADARTALDMIKSELESEQIDGQTYWFSSIKPIVEDVSPVSHLLPNYDEYVIGYKSRNQQVNGINTKGSNINDYIFNPNVIVNGKIVGAWKRIIKKGKVNISFNYYRLLSTEESNAVKEAAESYGKFLNMKVNLIESGTI